VEGVVCEVREWEGTGALVQHSRVGDRHDEPATKVELKVLRDGVSRGGTATTGLLVEVDRKDSACWTREKAGTFTRYALQVTRKTRTRWTGSEEEKRGGK